MCDHRRPGSSLAGAWELLPVVYAPEDPGLAKVRPSKSWIVFPAELNANPFFGAGSWAIKTTIATSVMTGIARMIIEECNASLLRAWSPHYLRLVYFGEEGIDQLKLSRCGLAREHVEEGPNIARIKMICGVSDLSPASPNAPTFTRKQCEPKTRQCPARVLQ